MYYVKSKIQYPDSEYNEYLLILDLKKKGIFPINL